MLVCPILLFSQTNETINVPDTAIVVETDSIVADSTISPDALDAEVTYKATDSIVVDIKSNLIYLYGLAEVYYEDIELKAAIIELNADSNTVYAYGRTDSLGNYVDKPVFKEGETSFESATMRYNFKTKKGKITDVITQEGEGYIHGESVKKLPDDVVFIKHGKYTTCSLDTPHFYISASKLKVIPDDKIVTGPACLYIEDVPTPLALPFGIFPNKKGKASGIVIPQYGESPALGFYLTEGGFYWTISDKMDLKVTGDIYSKGSWGGNINTNYAKRYKRTGNLNLDFSQIKNSYKEFPDYSVQKNFFVRWNHQQDAKARPNSRFSANVNAGTSTNFSNNFSTTSNDYLTNTFTSNISYSKTIPNSPFNFTINARHSQNTLNKSVSVTLPEAGFNMQRLYLYNKSKISGKGNVFQNTLSKIGFSYSSNFKNEINTYDSLISINRLENLAGDFKNGVRHSIPVSANFKAFNHLTITPSANYNEVWYFESLKSSYDTALDIVNTDTLGGFARNGSYNASINLSTKIYGTALFKKGKIAGIRHVFTPNVGLSYVPENKGGIQTYYDPIQNKDIEYNVLQNGLYGTLNQTEQGNITYGFINNLEMKIKTPNDTVNATKKIKLLENLALSGTYNMLADSLNFSNLSLSARTTLLNNLAFNFTSSIDPYRYELDSNFNAVKVDKLYWTDELKLGNITTANLGLSFSLQSKQKTKDKNVDTDNEDEQNQLKDLKQNPQGYVDFDLPWSVGVNYNIGYNKPNPFTESTLNQTVNLSGDVSLTQKWKVGFTTGYDVVQKELTYTTIDIYRDLHCWEMHLQWIPFGQRKSYSFTVNVKASVLQDLKVSRKREYFDLAQPF